MNVQKGDLAVVVRCPSAPVNVGAIRRVVDSAGAWFPAWVLDPPLPNGDDCACDTILRKIGDDQGTDETLLLAGLPQTNKNEETVA